MKKTFLITKEWSLLNNIRNNILNGLNKANDNDLIILSDSDEIPDLKKLVKLNPLQNSPHFLKKCLYKLNLQNLRKWMDWFKNM